MTTHTLDRLARMVFWTSAWWFVVGGITYVTLTGVPWWGKLLVLLVAALSQRLTADLLARRFIARGGFDA